MKTSRRVIGMFTVVVGAVAVACGGSKDAAPEDPPTGTACPLVCNGFCVDPLSEGIHCGACGHACPVGLVCANGVCSTTCPAGRTACGTSCRDISRDPGNCGGCGKACGGAAGACIGGTCSCAPSDLCLGVCKDLRWDRDNCGGCGNLCNEIGQACIVGACGCATGFIRCGTQCTPTSSDPKNCGACGVTCGAGEVCAAGKCTREGCGALTACGAACVDTQRDAANCLMCGNRCDPDNLCVKGQCQGFRVAAFCKTCPCPSCPATAACCAGPAVGSNAFCVDNGACP